MWWASYRFSRVITAHNIRAFLLARATTAFCHPARSRNQEFHTMSKTDLRSIQSIDFDAVALQWPELIKNFVFGGE